mgnify:CR=1 FL=1
MELSRNNVDSLVSGSQTKTAESVKKILDTDYFAEADERGESYDCHARFKYFTKEKRALTFLSASPLCLSPIPNESYFYCRGSLTEATRSRYDEIIPSRDYSSHSYEWKHLYSVEHAEDALKLVAEKLSEQQSDHKKHRIHLFGFLGDGQRSYTQLLSTKAFIELCAEANIFKQMCESDGFEYLALSLNHISQSEKSTAENITQSEIQNVNRQLQLPERNDKKIPPKTYVIFVDSLDSSIFKNKPYLENFPSLKRLFKDSLFFENFTSSGFWTFPCLHSLQSGIPPKYSSSFLKISPKTKLQYHKKRLAPSTIFGAFCYCSYSLSEIKSKSLTRLIRDAGIGTASIKSSATYSNYWNLQEGVDVSIENSTIDLIPYHLKQIQDQFEEDLGVIFLDIDTLHRGPLFYKKAGVNWGVDELDFIHKKQSKRNRLLGIRDTSFNEAARELSQLKKVDIVLQEILEQTDEQDTIILFSDNGSQNQPSTIPQTLNFIPGSSATIEKIWRPTLLVRSYKNTSEAGTRNELVSTSDIFSIVLHACGLGANAVFEDRYIDSILPPSLGGKGIRKVAETFGINTENLFIIEWVKRYSHEHGEYKAINMQGRKWYPIFELINDLESDFF